MYDMHTINHMYFEKRGFNRSNKNQAADYFAELADSLGFSLDLLKEGHNHNGKYCFQDKDVNTVFAILDWAKSSEGKRLRCRDYRGAGWEFIERLVQSLLKLMRSNGATSMTIWEQEYRMAITTDFAIQAEKIKGLKPELSEDLDGKFFVTESVIHEEDGFTSADRFTFLSFILEHLDFDAKNIRGVYWFWKSDNESRSAKETIREARKFRDKTPEEIEEFKQYLMGQLHFDQAVEADKELQETLQKWRDIETGGGKLKDNKLRKPLAHQVLDKLDQHAKEHLTSVSIDTSTQGGESDSEEASFAELMFDGEKHLSLACNHYSALKQYRREHPLTSEDDKRLIEIMFENRFGSPLI